MSRRGGPGTRGRTGRLRRWPVPLVAFLTLSAATRSLASNGTEASATSILSAAASVPPACLVRLAARDGADRTLFETVAAATAIPGLAVAPLHPLERGGVRWRSLAILPADEGASQPSAASWGVTTVASIARERDQVTLEVPGLPACGPGPVVTAAKNASSRLASGAAVLAARGRDGYRNRLVGGRVERIVELPGERRLLLVRLLDEHGADPGLLFDPSGSLLGSVLPGPSGDDPALATVVLDSEPAVPAAMAAPSQAARDAIAIAPSPSVHGTIPGLVSQALRLGGPARYERGLTLLDEAARQGGITVSLLLEKGVMEFSLGKIDSAVKDFRLAAGKDPLSHLARYNLGIALGTEGLYADAAAVLRSARDLQPEHGRTRFQLALALRALGLRDEARAELQDLSRIDPVLADELRALIGA